MEYPKGGRVPISKQKTRADEKNSKGRPRLNYGKDKA